MILRKLIFHDIKEEYQLSLFTNSYKTIIMAKGYSLIIGLNEVDPKHYAGWEGKLDQPENDATAICKLAETAGFKTKCFLTVQATRERINQEMQAAADQLQPNDIFFIYYSGHGGQVPDLDGDEEDGMDETWCLYNGQLIDDEIHYLLTTFKPGVRILVLSDSCHSGTITKALPWEDQEVVEKMMPYEFIMKSFEQNEKFYVQIAEKLQKIHANDLEVFASVLQISGCQDYETSLAFRKDTYSLFTTALLKCVEEQKMNYQLLHQSITEVIDERLRKTGRRQTPNFFLSGKENPKFIQEEFLKIE